MCDKRQIENLKNLLRSELGYLPTDSTVEAFISAGEFRHFKNRDTIIEVGKKNSDVYAIENGIVRFTDMDGDRERVFAFATPGTLFMSKHSFVMDLPSHYNVEACTPCCLWTISKKNFWEVVNRYHDLSLWLLHYSYGEMFYQEYKNANVCNGNARERYLSILKDRPEIIKNVPQKFIAAYIGISPEYFSKLKKEFSK